MGDEMGESYDMFTKQLVVASEIAPNDGYSQTNMSVLSTNRSAHSSLPMHAVSNSNIAAAAPMNAESISYHIDTSRKNLYEAKASRVAIEGQTHSHFGNTNSTKMAATKQAISRQTNYSLFHGEPRVASPVRAPQISYIYCRN